MHRLFLYWNEVSFPMDIAQEVSKAQALVEDGIQSPVISNRKAETSLVVQNGETVVIGGLIEEVESYVISGIPYLSRLPWIGFLFGTTSISKAKKELILLITPHVIETINDQLKNISQIEPSRHRSLIKFHFGQLDSPF